MNLCFDALDLRIIRGRATDPAVVGIDRPLDYANLLEQVGALAGLFHSVGIVPGSHVGVHLTDQRVELLTVLATARLGATSVELRPGRLEEFRPDLVVADEHLDLAGHEPATVLLHGPDPVDERRDLAWEIGYRAGRTEPAGAAEISDDQVAWVVDGPVRVADIAADESRYGGWLRDLIAGRPIDLAGA